MVVQAESERVVRVGTRDWDGSIPLHVLFYVRTTTTATTTARLPPSPKCRSTGLPVDDTIEWSCQTRSIIDDVANSYLSMSSSELPSKSTAPVVVVEGRNVTSVPENLLVAQSTLHEEPPPPPRSQKGDELWALPPGWTTARHVKDGRIYYVQEETGRTSWVHPMAAGGGADSSENPTSKETKWGGLVSAFTNNNPWKRRGAKPTTINDGLMKDDNNNMNTPLTQAAATSERPESHQCWACLALILCFPIGLCAMYHSYRVDKACQEGRYGDAVDHSRQAEKYGTLGIVLGAILVVIFLLSRREEPFEFFRDFHLDWFD